jgi:carboxyl-terminal processing protease
MTWTAALLRVVMGCVVLGCALAARAAPPDAAGLTDAERANHLAAFDEVWETVRDRHYDADLNGVDWVGARERYRPLVEGADSVAAVRGAMNAMLATLGESHFAIVPRDAYESLEDDAPDGDAPEQGEPGGPLGWHGLQIRARGGDLVVTRVEPGSPGERAGLVVGDVVRSIAGREGGAMLAAAETAAENAPARAETIAAMAAEGRLGGRAGQSRTLVVGDDAMAIREVVLTLADDGARPVSVLGLPPMRVRFDSRDAAPGVRYLTFDAFLDPQKVTPAYNAVLREATSPASEVEALVIDLRGNVGGLLPMINGMCGWFVEKPTALGAMQLRGTTLRAFANPRATPFVGPVAVLIDEVSISSAEIMSGGLKDIGRARVFGTRTAGLALPSQFTRLPNGDALQFVFADFTGPAGERLEGVGVTPHEVIDARPVRGQGDPVLNAALRWIRAETAGN